MWMCARRKPVRYRFLTCWISTWRYELRITVRDSPSYCWKDSVQSKIFLPIVCVYLCGLFSIPHGRFSSSRLEDHIMIIMYADFRFCILWRWCVLFFFLTITLMLKLPNGALGRISALNISQPWKTKWKQFTLRRCAEQSMFLFVLQSGTDSASPNVRHSIQWKADLSFSGQTMLYFLGVVTVMVLCLEQRVRFRRHRYEG